MESSWLQDQNIKRRKHLPILDIQSRNHLVQYTLEAKGHQYYTKIRRTFTRNKTNELFLELHLLGKSIKDGSRNYCNHETKMLDIPLYVFDKPYAQQQSKGQN